MDTIDTGTERATRVIGRDLVHAATRAVETHGITDVTRDGKRVAVVMPAGPQDRTPDRAELDALVGHLMTRMAPAFKPGAQVGEAGLLGVALARFLDHLGSDVLAVAEAALTESNMHGTAEEVRGLREDIERGGS